MPLDRTHVLQAFLAKGRITPAEYDAAVADSAKFDALVARVATQNSKKN